MAGFVPMRIIAPSKQLAGMLVRLSSGIDYLGFQVLETPCASLRFLIAAANPAASLELESAYSARVHLSGYISGIRCGHVVVGTKREIPKHTLRAAVFGSAVAVCLDGYLPHQHHAGTLALGARS